MKSIHIYTRKSKYAQCSAELNQPTMSRGARGGAVIPEAEGMGGGKSASCSCWISAKDLAAVFFCLRPPPVPPPL